MQGFRTFKSDLLTLALLSFIFLFTLFAQTLSLAGCSVLGVGDIYMNCHLCIFVHAVLLI